MPCPSDILRGKVDAGRRPDSLVRPRADGLWIGPAVNNKPLPGFLIRFPVRRGLGAMPDFSKEDIRDGDLNDVNTYLKALRRNG